MTETTPPGHARPRPRTLYLCPGLPGAASTGGMHAHAHLLRGFGRALGDRLTVVAADTAGRGVAGRLAAQARMPGWPDKVTMRASRAARARVKGAIDAGTVDLVVVDHFDALALFDPDWAVARGVPILYVAHNDEARLARDVAHCLRVAGQGPAAPLRALAWRIEARRTARHEARLLRAASTVVFLSSHDRDALRAAAPQARAFVHLPIDLPAIAPAREPAPGAPTVLFGANAAFAPNLEALQWLACALAPALAAAVPGATLRVTGIDAARVPPAWRAAGVEWSGFLPHDGYARALREARAFVCPVARGSGVKMKVLEAIAAGVPVLADAASWRGIDAAPESMVLPRDPVLAARRIAAALADPGTLQRSADALRARLRAALAAQPSIESMIAETLAPAGGGGVRRSAQATPRPSGPVPAQRPSWPHSG